MILRFCLIALFIANSWVLFGQTTKPDCKKFKTGKFETTNSTGTTSTIERTRKYQIETFDNVEVKSEIIWLSDCSYKTIPVSVKNLPEEMMKIHLIVNIVETYDHSYKAIITVEGDKTILIESMIYEYGYMNSPK